MFTEKNRLLIKTYGNESASKGKTHLLMYAKAGQDIFMETAKITGGYYQRAWLIENEPENSRQGLNELYAQDTRSLKIINERMMQINEMCRQQNIEPMFPMANPNVNYEEIKQAANNFLSEISIENERLSKKYKQKYPEMSQTIEEQTRFTEIPSGIKLPRRKVEEANMRGANLDEELMVPDMGHHVIAELDEMY